MRDELHRSRLFIVKEIGLFELLGTWCWSMYYIELSRWFEPLIVEVLWWKVKWSLDKTPLSSRLAFRSYRQYNFACLPSADMKNWGCLKVEVCSLHTSWQVNCCSLDSDLKKARFRAQHVTHLVVDPFSQSLSKILLHTRKAHNWVNESSTYAKSSCCDQLEEDS